MRSTPRIALVFGLLFLFVANAAFAAGLPTLIDTWGTLGNGPGQFDHPGGVCVEGTSYVYIADQGNNRVQKFTPDGTFVTMWGTQGNGPAQLFHPARIHLAANGELLVVEHQNHRVSRYSTSGTFLGSFGSPGTALGQFSHPVGVTTDADGNIYVAEYTTNRIQKFTSAFTPITTWPANGPYGVEFGPDGFLYVSEYNGSTVKKFTTAGALVQIIGGPGSGPGRFAAAEGVAFDADGNLYVADTGHDKIQQFSPAGTYLGDFAVPVGTQSELRPIPCDVAIDPDGNLYVVAFGSARIHKYAPPNQPPDCSAATVRPRVAWPPNHKMRQLLIEGVTDPDGDPVTIRVTSITQDEPLRGPIETDPDPDLTVELPSGDVDAGGLSAGDRDGGDISERIVNNRNSGRCQDAEIGPSGNAWIRLERVPRGHGGNGRVYHVTFEASDGQATCGGSADVCVPLKKNGDCVDDGQTVNSLESCGSDALAELGAIAQAGSRIGIDYRMAAPGEVSIGVYDVAGRQVAMVERGRREAGDYGVQWDAGSLARGVYFVRLTSAGAHDTRTIVVR